MPSPETQRRSPAGPVFLTVCGLLLIAALASVPFVAGEPSKEGLPDLAKFFGRFHPVFLHLPIGMLLLVLILEIGHFFPRRKTGYSTRVAMFFAAASAVVATILGLLLYYGTGNYRDELAERHLYGGIIFACGMVAAYVVKAWVDHSAGKGTWIYWSLLLGSTGAMGIASHDGGSLTHGEGYLTAFAPDPVRNLIGLPPKGPKPASGDGDALDAGDPVAGGLPADPVVYTDIMIPIFAQKCYSCHSEEKRVRGKYRMEEYDLLVKGGSEGDGIVHGDSSASNLIVRIDLPLEDEEHMPPEDKEQLEPHEVVLIRWWIDSGASPDKKLSELQPPDEVTEAVAAFASSAGSADSPPAAGEEQTPEEKMSAAPKEEVDKLRREFPTALNFEYQSSPGLVFTAVSMRKDFGDDGLAKLVPVIGSLVSLDLTSTSVTDAGVAYLADAAELRSLRLSETEVTDAALDALADLDKLESLNLYGTRVTNEGILKLASLSNLKKLYLWRTQVDEAGVQALREKLPGCEIVLGS